MTRIEKLPLNGGNLHQIVYSILYSDARLLSGCPGCFAFAFLFWYSVSNEVLPSLTALDIHAAVDC